MFLSCARFSQACHDIAQGTVNAKGFVFDIVGDIDLAKIDGHIGGVRFLRDQPHEGHFYQLVAPADAKLQNRQLFSMILAKKRSVSLPGVL